MINSLMTISRHKDFASLIYTGTDCCQKCCRTSIYTKKTSLGSINLCCIFLSISDHAFCMMKIIKPMNFCNIPVKRK